jgi:hypothetical protein
MHTSSSKNCSRLMGSYTFRTIIICLKFLHNIVYFIFNLPLINNSDVTCKTLACDQSTVHHVVVAR